MRPLLPCICGVGSRLLDLRRVLRVIEVLFRRKSFSLARLKTQPSLSAKLGLYLQGFLMMSAIFLNPQIFRMVLAGQSCL